MRLVPLNMFKPSSIFLTDRGSFLLFMFHICLCYTVLSAPGSLAVTCWERADLLTLLCVVFSCVFDMVSQVRCGT